MSRLSVTCVIPLFNGRAHLAAAIDSVLAQAYEPLTILVVDDGSTDGGTDVLSASHRAAITVVRQPNSGPAAARNRGIALAATDLIAFLDQDDRWHPDKLSRQAAHLQRAPHVDASVAHVESVWPSPAEGQRAANQPRSGVVPGYITGTLLARRRAFDRVGVFNPDYRYLDSLDWFARAADCGVTVELLPDVLLYHHVHSENLSRRGDESRAECLRILRTTRQRRQAAQPL